MTFRHLLFPVALAASLACPASTADSLRAVFPSLQGKERLSAAVRLYEQSGHEHDEARQLYYLNEWKAEASRQHDAKSEGRARLLKICLFYNLDWNDSVTTQAPLDMDFNRQHQNWENYYETWNHLANTYIFSGRVNTGLREVQRMHDEALRQDNKYGMGIAYYGMGNAYINMGYLDEAEQSYEKSLQLLSQISDSPTILNDLYSYYCDALSDRHDYQRLKALTRRWKTFLDGYAHRQAFEPGDSEGNIWYAYYYIACVQADLGLGSLDEAAANLEEVQKRSQTQGDYIYMSYLYYRGQYELQRKDYAKALDYNTRRLQKSMEIDDVSSLVMIRQQRAEILKGLGRYEEAAEMYRQMYELNDSLNKKETRTQLSELNTMFHVNEFEMEQRLSRNRYALIIGGVIILSLVLLVSYWFVMTRRLRRKNEELVVARDQAQESSRMKSDFIKNISHEIRTPLNILSGFTQIVTQPGITLPDELRQEASEKIVENTNRITTLINQLLALSEANSRTVIEQTDTLPCNGLCAQAIAESHVADSVRHRFTFDTSLADDVLLTTHQAYAVKALAHLLDNAQKFTPDGGSIRLTCRADQGWLRVAVEDTGVGVPAEAAERIFGEFVQLDEYKEGVGIGLSVSRNIVRRLGGDILLDTSYTGGARFVYSLPLSR